MPDIILQRWSEDDWFSRRIIWNEVLDNSGADSVFGSWEWQTGWWRHFGRSGWELWLLAFEQHGRVVGFFPAYFSSVRRRGLKIRSVQLIGQHFRDPVVLTSEYLDVIAQPEYASEVASAGLEYLLEKTRCGEFVVCCGRLTGYLQQALRQRGIERGAYCRDTDTVDAYSADLRKGFRSYLDSLGASTRRRLYGMRRRLEAFGKTRFDHAPTHAIDETLDLLNRLHSTRWGKFAFSGDRLAFHREYAHEMSVSDRLMLSRLWIADRIVSVSYDVLGSRAQYNLQMGFDQDFSARLSLGLLHIGYALEDAAARNVARYDFLAGAGLRTQYKLNIAQDRQVLASRQLLVSRSIAQAYRLYDRFVG